MTTNADNQSSSDVVGILFMNDRLDGCRAIQTFFGSIRYQHATVSIDNGDLATALQDLMQMLGAGKQSLPIAAAIPTENCYFATRPITTGGSTASPRVLLRESLRSNSARLDQMAIDVIHWQPDRRNVAGICAAPNETVDRIRTAVAATKHSLQRVEPAAACLIGVAPTYEGRERRNSLTTRVLLGNTSLLAVMSRGAKPIHWQRLPLPAGDEGTGIVSAIRALETAATACGLDRTPDNVVIHGRSQLRSLMDSQWLESSLPGNFRWIDEPTLEGQDVAKSLAMRLLEGNDEGFDLVRQHRDPLKLRRVVPYREIVAYVVAACVLAFVQWTRLDGIEGQRMSLVATAPPIIGDGSNPKPEQENLSARAGAVSQFLDKRVMWSGVLADVTSKLPEGMQLTNISASAPMARSIRGKSKDTPAKMTLRAKCALSEDGSMPTSLNNLAENFAGIESVADHFETVELSDLHRTRDSETGVAGAEFSVIFTAKTRKGR
ncbi:hypothetical protein N9N28_05440 [Rubripirellula amarantea]|nr:hypothetical protein [Rubripirellula amarantea]